MNADQAAAQCPHLDPWALRRFHTAYHKARHAALHGQDTDGPWHRMRDTATIAGWLHGLASTRTTTTRRTR